MAGNRRCEHALSGLRLAARHHVASVMEALMSTRKVMLDDVPKRTAGPEREVKMVCTCGHERGKGVRVCGGAGGGMCVYVAVWEEGACGKRQLLLAQCGPQARLLLAQRVHALRLMMSPMPWLEGFH